MSRVRALMAGSVAALLAGTLAPAYGTFSGWDQYRARIQLLALLRPDVAGDMAQSMLDFAAQNNGVWDRWLHLGAPTHVMTRAGRRRLPTCLGITVERLPTRPD